MSNYNNIPSPNTNTSSNILSEDELTESEGEQPNSYTQCETAYPWHPPRLLEGYYQPLLPKLSTETPSQTLKNKSPSSTCLWSNECSDEKSHSFNILLITIVQSYLQFCQKLHILSPSTQHYDEERCLYQLFHYNNQTIHALYNLIHPLHNNVSKDEMKNEVERVESMISTSLQTLNELFSTYLSQQLNSTIEYVDLFTLFQIGQRYCPTNPLTEAISHSITTCNLWLRKYYEVISSPSCTLKQLQNHLSALIESLPLLRLNEKTELENKINDISEWVTKARAAFSSSLSLSQAINLLKQVQSIIPTIITPETQQMQNHLTWAKKFIFLINKKIKRHYQTRNQPNEPRLTFDQAKTLLEQYHDNISYLVLNDIHLLEEIIEKSTSLIESAQSLLQNEDIAALESLSTQLTEYPLSLPQEPMIQQHYQFVVWKKELFNTLLHIKPNHLTYHQLSSFFLKMPTPVIEIHHSISQTITNLYHTTTDLIEKYTIESNSKHPRLSFFLSIFDSFRTLPISFDFHEEYLNKLYNSISQHMNLLSFLEYLVSGNDQKEDKNKKYIDYNELKTWIEGGYDSSLYFYDDTPLSFFCHHLYSLSSLLVSQTNSALSIPSSLPSLLSISQQWTKSPLSLISNPYDSLLYKTIEQLQEEIQSYRDALFPTKENTSIQTHQLTLKNLLKIQERCNIIEIPSNEEPLLTISSLIPLALHFQKNAKNLLVSNNVTFKSKKRYLNPIFAYPTLSQLTSFLSSLSENPLLKIVEIPEITELKIYHEKITKWNQQIPEIIISSNISFIKEYYQHIIDIPFRWEEKDHLEYRIFALSWLEQTQIYLSSKTDYQTLINHYYLLFDISWSDDVLSHFQIKELNDRIIHHQFWINQIYSLFMKSCGSIRTTSIFGPLPLNIFTPLPVFSVQSSSFISSTLVSYFSEPQLENIQKKLKHSLSNDPLPYCLCQLTADAYNTPELMVFCESCQNWFHLQCLNITRSELKYIPSFMCSVCSRQNRSFYLFRHKYPPKSTKRGPKLEDVKQMLSICHPLINSSYSQILSQMISQAQNWIEKCKLLLEKHIKGESLNWEDVEVSVSDPTSDDTISVRVVDQIAVLQEWHQQSLKIHLEFPEKKLLEERIKQLFILEKLNEMIVQPTTFSQLQDLFLELSQLPDELKEGHDIDSFLQLYSNCVTWINDVKRQLSGQYTLTCLRDLFNYHQTWFPNVDCPEKEIIHKKINLGLAFVDRCIHSLHHHHRALTLAKLLIERSSQYPYVDDIHLDRIQKELERVAQWEDDFEKLKNNHQTQPEDLLKEYIFLKEKCYGLNPVLVENRFLKEIEYYCKYHCICNQPYSSFKNQNRIICEYCGNIFHPICLGFIDNNLPHRYCCYKCLPNQQLSSLSSPIESIPLLRVSLYCHDPPSLLLYLISNFLSSHFSLSNQWYYDLNNLLLSASPPPSKSISSSFIESLWSIIYRYFSKSSLPEDFHQKMTQWIDQISSPNYLSSSFPPLTCPLPAKPPSAFQIYVNEMKKNTELIKNEINILNYEENVKFNQEISQYQTNLLENNNVIVPKRKHYRTIPTRVWSDKYKILDETSRYQYKNKSKLEKIKYKNACITYDWLYLRPIEPSRPLLAIPVTINDIETKDIEVMYFWDEERDNQDCPFQTENSSTILSALPFSNQDIVVVSQEFSQSFNQTTSTHLPSHHGQHRSRSLPPSPSQSLPSNSPFTIIIPKWRLSRRQQLQSTLKEDNDNMNIPESSHINTLQNETTIVSSSSLNTINGNNNITTFNTQPPNDTSIDSKTPSSHLSSAHNQTKIDNDF